MINNIINFLNNFRFNLKRNDDLSGITIMIIGSSGKVGQIISKYMYSLGANLILFSRKDIKTADRMFSSDRSLYLKGDSLNENDIQTAFKLGAKKFKNVQVLINTVGTFLDKKIVDINTNDINRIFDMNFKTVVVASKIGLLNLKPGGTIINFGSWAARNKNISDGKSLYASSKKAVETFSVALANEGKKYKIRVVCLEPATISNFISKDFLNYMNPMDIAMLIEMIIKLKEIDFGVFSFKSRSQNI